MNVLFGLSMPELLLILVIALVVFGPGKLPEIGKALGKGINEFRRAMDNTRQPADKAAVETKNENKSA